MSEASGTSGGRPDMSEASSASSGRTHGGDTRAERLAGALDDFIAASPDLEAAAVVSFDGLAMASALPPDMDEDRLGAMSAALLSLGEQAANGLGRGELNQVFVEGEHGYVFLMSALDQAVLAAVTDHAAKIGLMLFEMRRAAAAVGRILAPAGTVQQAHGQPAGAGAGAEIPRPGGDPMPPAGHPPPRNGSAPAGAVVPPWS